ncbi:Arylsulfatase [Labrenzia sp. THAF35]|uniref:sulfatase family protein n=1 Tax=Labrenzia sp. THAF35 TaxID=2587854 RepID=UPI001268E499|nr:sulfatase-like hydrolase/transferase [Labrenzia sp. THAF35]MEC9421059.1 sulfatase-like hydrolase/transferase [Pseudomonadota bacterium]QFT67909.1 Arylsulfatase [Labrenzia sp. THAF35]
MRETGRPNILFFMPDQLRADFLGCYGARFARTPNIDALAARGMLFDRCLSPNPICVPARASLLTGTTSLENGVLVNGAWLRPDRRECGLDSWPELLSQGGYDTCSIGKMHFYPWDASEGFHERVVAEDKRQIGIRDDYADFLESRGKCKRHGREFEGYRENAGACYSPLAKEEQVDLWCADQAVSFLERRDGTRPFALMVGFPSPHCPYDPPPEIAALFDPEEMPPPLAETAESEALRPWLISNMKNPWADLDYSVFTNEQKAKVRAHYSALIHIVDLAVGRVLTALDRLGLSDDTIIVFASDHGDFVGDYSLVCKNFFMDPSIRVPMIVAGPGVSRQIRADTVTLSDLYPTFLQLAGLEARKDLGFASLFQDAPDEPRVICGATHRGFMIEKDRKKLARYVGGTITLHDMEADPGEQVNLADDPKWQQVRQDLDRALTDWQVAETIKGHREKTIVYAAETKPQPGSDPGILGRNWQRPYPWSAETARR